MGDSYRDTTITLASQVLVGTHIATVFDKLNSRRGGIILVFHEISQTQLAKQLMQLSELYTFIPLS